MGAIARKAVAVAVAMLLLTSSARAALGQDDDDAATRSTYRLRTALTTLVRACDRDVVTGVACDFAREAIAIRPSDRGDHLAAVLNRLSDAPREVSRATWFHLQLRQYLNGGAEEWPLELSAAQAWVMEACSDLPEESALFTRLRTARGVDEVLDGQLDLDGATSAVLDCVEALIDAEEARAKMAEELLAEWTRLNELCGDCRDTPAVEVVETDLREIETTLEKIRDPQSRRPTFNLLKALASFLFVWQAAVVSVFTGGQAMEDWQEVFYGSDPGGGETTYERLPASAGEEIDPGREAELEGATVPYDSSRNSGIPVRFRKVGSGAEVHLQMFVGRYATPWVFRDCATGEDDAGCVAGMDHSLRELLQQPDFHLVGQVATGLEKLPDGTVRWDHVTLRGAARGVRFTILERSTRSRTYVLVVEDQ